LSNQKTASYTLVIAALVLIVALVLAVVLVIGVLSLNTRTANVNSADLAQTIDSVVNDRLSQLTQTQEAPSTEAATERATRRGPTPTRVRPVARSATPAPTRRRPVSNTPRPAATNTVASSPVATNTVEPEPSEDPGPESTALELTAGAVFDQMLTATAEQGAP
jgi:hypothetical protein